MKYKILFYSTFTILVIFILIILFKNSKPFSVLNSKGKSEVIAIVDRGQVIVSVEASGVVESENEVIILSPTSSIIKSIHKEPGSRVNRGEVIMELDPEPVINEIENISAQLDVKRNNLEKTRLNNHSTLIDLEYNAEVKKLRITSLKSQLADEEQLLSVGGISPARVEETRQNITLAEKDLAMVVEKNEIRLKQLKADEEGLMMQIRMQEKQLEGKKELLEKMEVKAQSDGIILTISGKVGEKINADRMLARMSDMTTFKIIGSIDERYSELIKTGNQVFAIIDNERLAGRIGNITPEVENNKIQFNVHLDDSNHPGLIANQAVRLQVVQAIHDSTLRIPSSKDFYPNNEQSVMVMDSEKVVRRNVKFGMKGNEYQEIISGLKEGDKVLASGLSTDIFVNDEKTIN